MKPMMTYTEKDKQTCATEANNSLYVNKNTL